MGLFSWSSLSGVLVVVYISFSVHKMYQMMNPLYGVEINPNTPTVDPLWKRDQQFSMVIYLSTSHRVVSKITDIPQKAIILWKELDLNFDKLQHEITKNVILTPSDLNSTILNNSKNTSLINVPKNIWKNVYTNKSAIYLHVILTANDNDFTNIEAISDKYTNTLYGSVKLIKFDVIPKSFRNRYLLSDFGLVGMPEEDVLKNRMPRDTIISYWKPEVAVRLVTDFSSFPVDLVPPALHRYMVEKRGGDSPSQQNRKKQQQSERKYFYKPPIHVDEIGLTSDKYIPLNRTVLILPLKLSYAPMSLERWLLMSTMEQSLSDQKQIGFTDKDIDDVRRLISDTSVYLLGITILASLLHLFFEFLAFQSDIQFWNDNKSLAGLSTRAVITDLFSQIIIFLFLVDSETSILVTIPSFIGILIQVWKVNKATGLALRRNSSSLLGYTLEFSRWKESSESSKITESLSNRKDESNISSDSTVSDTPKSAEPSTIISSTSSSLTEEELTKVTLEADRVATRYLGLSLLPIAIGMTLRSLLVDKHASWYSWGIGALTGFVYAFGFVLMCPQLFINHKLKTVAFLPWNYLIYKFLNTFIDDLFAFVIKMPTMHRLSVFRDDIVFLIYLYQRWIYRVDKSRPIEK